MPTPASRAIASSVPSPPVAKARAATSSRRSRLRCASARSARSAEGGTVGPSSTRVANRRFLRILFYPYRRLLRSRVYGSSGLLGPPIRGDTPMTTALRLTTPFDATSTADDVLAGVDLRGRRAIVTGGASGIGLETARALARAGAEVTLAVRDLAAGQRAGPDVEERPDRARLGQV